MGADSKIEWTDASWTPIRARRDGRVGWHCEHVSPGCVNCYSETMNLRLGTGRAFAPDERKAGGVEVFLDQAMLLAPLKWKHPRKIFVCSMTDLFADFVEEAWLDAIFSIMAMCPQHTFQVLTKRSERMLAYMTALTAEIESDIWTSRLGRMIGRVSKFAGHAFPGNAIFELMNNDEEWKAHPDVIRRAGGWPARQIWMGVSTEDQRRANERIPHLLATPAAVHFLSCEPLLGAVDLKWALSRNPIEIASDNLRRGMFSPGLETLRQIDLVIVGGESGPKRRPMDLAWARSLRDQCAAAEVSFFMKQIDKVQPIPDDLLVREFPT